MGNMSYCRFENTASDLADCEEALSEMVDCPEETSPVNKHELDAAPRLFDSAAAILERLAEVVGASIIVTGNDGREWDLSSFDWKDPWVKVQRDVAAANKENTNG